VFKFSAPETKLQFDLQVYPGISDTGRYRATGDFSLTHKLTGDFTLGVTAYLSYDNRPPVATAETSDYGITFNLGYSFGR
jgi:putative salt-induced outer membrane protein YdiY